VDHHNQSTELGTDDTRCIFTVGRATSPRAVLMNMYFKFSINHHVRSGSLILIFLTFNALISQTQLRMSPKLYNISDPRYKLPSL
jgi:hypothetical protein